MNNEINRLLKVITNSKKSIFLILIIFIAIGYMYSFYYKTPMYKSTATFVLVQNTGDDKSITQKDLAVNQNLISTYSNIAKSNKVLRQVIDNLDLEISEKDLSKQISIEAVKNTEVLKITVSDKNNEKAAKIANELYKIFSQEVKNLYNISNVHIMDLAEVSEQAYNINHIKDIIMFVILGTAISSLYIGIIYIIDTTIKSEKDVETYTDLAVLSTIPLTDVKNNSELITKNEPKSIISESFKTLRTNIMYSIQNKKLKTILITSGYMGEGKSFVSSNLAITFAQSGKKVIFIDTDMRKGRIHKIFNIQNKKGLSNCLSEINENKNKVDINKFINKTEISNLYIMTAGDVPPNPSELLASSIMKKLLYTLNTQYDVIICDSAPCMLVTDSIVLSKIIDTTIIVTSNKTTKINNLIETEKSIKLVGGNISGVIINKMNENKKEYKNKYYYGHPEEIIENKENNINDIDILKNKLYLKEIKTEKNENKIENNKIEKNNNINKSVQKIKDNSNEIKELKSLYKVLMKNTLNILLNREEKAESILNKIDNIKNTYRDDLEVIKNNQEKYEQELLKLKNNQQINKKEITNLKRAQTNTKKEIKGLKNSYKKEINIIGKKQNNYEEKIKLLKEEFLEVQKDNQNRIQELINKIEELQKENNVNKIKIKGINKNIIKNNNKTINNGKSEEKIVEMQKYINNIEENKNTNINEIKEDIIESTKNEVPENQIIIKEIKIQKLKNNKNDNKYAIDYEKIRNKNKKIFAFFNKKENYNNKNNSKNEIEENNEIISQILLGTK